MGTLEDELYDVIVVGGRPAGASLAARLGAEGLRVLVLERASFPSRPAVSAPFVLPHTLALLDELGLDEAVYAAQTPRLRQSVLEFGDYFRTSFGFTEPVAGRTHFYVLDRGRLDLALWRSLDRFDTVTALEATPVVDLRWEDARVAGVVARPGGQRSAVELRARCVVGADGRHGVVARKVGAPVTHRRTDRDTTVYYAHWEGVVPYEAGGEPVAQIHTSCDGFSFVLMPTADDQVIVVAQGQSDLYAALAGSPQQSYESLLRARPRVWRRLASARRVSPLSGIKRIGNLFRQAHGPGWALVGDAYHQKDSIDAQGIYDALFGARRLAEALTAWHAGGRPWDEALGGYARDVEEEFRPMFEATMERVQREIYSVPPPAAARTVMRWILTHPRYHRRFGAVLTRRMDPRQLLAPSVVVPAMLGGAVGRVRARFSARPDPTDPIALGSVG